MTLPLRLRLLLYHAVVIAAGLAIATGLAIRAHRSWLVARHLESLESAARRAVGALPPDPAAHPGGIPALADSLGRLLGARVTLIDSSGVVRGDSEVPRAALSAVENHADRPEVRAALAGHAGSGRRHSRTIDRDLLYLAVPVARVAGIAVLRLAEPLAVVADLDASLVRVALASALLALLLSIPLALLVSARE